MTAGVVLRVVGAVVLRPGVWSPALRVVARTARTGWWRRPPFLPLPTRDYIAFRMETQYGSAGGDRPRVMSRTVVDDVLKYLRWVKQWDSVHR